MVGIPLVTERELITEREPGYIGRGPHISIVRPTYLSKLKSLPIRRPIDSRAPDVSLVG